MGDVAHVITDLPPNARSRWHVDQMITNRVDVDGRPAVYATGGRGLPVLFLHGWGLDHRAYQRSLRRLTARGCRVIAPSLPGFGGTAALPTKQRTLAGYADWVADFVSAIGVTDPMVVLGHSMGGGVATKFAHDHGEMARYLVVLNSVGDPSAIVGNLLSRAFDVRALVDPMVQLALPNSAGSTARLVPRVFVENIMRDPVAMLDAARLAMSADLGDEMSALAARGLPTLVLWSDHDGVIPLSAFDTFCSTFRADGQVVAGGHSWLLASPDVFGQVLDNIVHVQALQHHEQAATASVDQLRSLLRETTVPETVTRRLLKGVSPLWVLSAPPAVLAADLALCHPKLQRDEVRAVARSIRSSNLHRLTVVARDRPGLLADTAAVLAIEGASVVSASAMTWPRDGLALHSLTVKASGGLDQQRWAAIGARLPRRGRGRTRPGAVLRIGPRRRVGHRRGRRSLGGPRHRARPARTALGGVPLVRRERRLGRGGEHLDGRGRGEGRVPRGGCVRRRPARRPPERSASLPAAHALAAGVQRANLNRVPPGRASPRNVEQS